MSTIRLTINNKTRQVLDLLEEEYKPMSRAEILKMGLAELYNKSISENVHYLDARTSDNIDKSRDEIRRGKSKSFETVDDLISDLESDV